MKPWIIISTALLFVGVGAFFLSSDSKTDIINYPPKEGPIVAFGDSLVQGVGASEENDFVSLLSQKINEPVINLGLSGNTTADGLLRLGEVFEMQPRIVIVLLGGNDYIRRIPEEITFQNLEELISRIQETGAVVVLLGVRGGLITDGYSKSFADLAEKTGVVYVEDVLDGIFGDSTRMSDGIHPNDKGYEFIADKVYQKLLPILR